MIESTETALPETPAPETALPEWTAPTVTCIELKRTMLASGGSSDGIASTNNPV